MFAEACLMQGWDLKCERNAGRRSGQTRFVSFLIPRFILVSGKDWLVFVLLVLIQSLGDELFKHWKDNQRSSCEFWIPVFQSGLRSSLFGVRPACTDLSMLRLHLHCKPRSISEIERRAVHVRARASSPHIFSRPSPALNIWFSGARCERTQSQTHVKRVPSLWVPKVQGGPFPSLLLAPRPWRGLRWQLWTDAVGSRGADVTRCICVAARWWPAAHLSFGTLPGSWPRWTDEEARWTRGSAVAPWPLNLDFFHPLILSPVKKKKKNLPNKMFLTPSRLLCEFSRVYVWARVCACTRVHSLSSLLHCIAVQ